jgi:RNA polymerase sigma factor (sigma-70 family)
VIDPLRYRGVVVLVARHFLGRGHDMPDLVQEGMLGVLLAARRWAEDRPGEPMPSGWARKWAENTLRSLTRKRACAVIVADDLDLVADDQAGSEPDTAAIGPLLALLSGREADVLVLRLGLDGNPGRSAVETGRALSIWPSRVQVIEKQALAKLRKALTDDDDP